MVFFGVHGDGIPPGTGTGTRTCECLQRCTFSFKITLESTKGIQRRGFAGRSRGQDPGGPPGAGKPKTDHLEDRRTVIIDVKKRIEDFCVNKGEADQLLAQQGPISSKLPECLKSADGEVINSSRGSEFSLSRVLEGKIERLRKKEFSSECCAPTFEGERLKCLTVCNGVIQSQSENVKCVDDCAKLKRIERRRSGAISPQENDPFKKGYNWSICEMEQEGISQHTRTITCTNTHQGDNLTPPPASQTDSDLIDVLDMDEMDGDETEGMDWMGDEMTSRRDTKNFGRKVRNALRSSDCDSNSPSGRIKKAFCATIEELMSECAVSDKCCDCC